VRLVPAEFAQQFGFADAPAPIERKKTRRADVCECGWLAFQPSDMRVCGACHGLSELYQAGHGPPQHTPQALVDLLTLWADDNPSPAERAIYLPVVVQ